MDDIDELSERISEINDQLAAIKETLREGVSNQDQFFEALIYILREK